jgi:hypothetical protein
MVVIVTLISLRIDFSDASNVCSPEKSKKTIKIAYIFQLLIKYRPDIVQEVSIAFFQYTLVYNLAQPFHFLSALEITLKLTTLNGLLLKSSVMTVKGAQKGSTSVLVKPIFL